MIKKVVTCITIIIISTAAYYWGISFISVPTFAIREMLAKIVSFSICLVLWNCYCKQRANTAITIKLVVIVLMAVVFVSALDGIYSATNNTVLVCTLAVIFWLISVGVLVAPILKMRSGKVFRLLLNRRSIIIIAVATVITVLFMYTINAYNNIHTKELLSSNISLLAYLSFFSNHSKGFPMMITHNMFISMFFIFYTREQQENSVDL